MMDSAVLVTPYDRPHAEDFDLLTLLAWLRRHGSEPGLVQLGDVLTERERCRVAWGAFEDDEHEALLQRCRPMLENLPEVWLARYDGANVEFLRSLRGIADATGRRLLVLGPASQRPIVHEAPDFYQAMLFGRTLHPLAGYLFEGRDDLAGLRYPPLSGRPSAFTCSGDGGPEPYSLLATTELPPHLLEAFGLLPLDLGRAGVGLEAWCGPYLGPSSSGDCTAVAAYLERWYRESGRTCFGLGGPCPQNDGLDLLREVLDLVQHLGLCLAQRTPFRPDLRLDAAFFRAWRGAGAATIEFEVPTFSDRLAATFALGYDRGTVARNLRDAAAAGLELRLGTRLGWPDEREDEVFETCRYLEQLAEFSPKLVRLLPYQLVSCTAFYDHALHHGVRFPKRFKLWRFEHGGQCTLSERIDRTLVVMGHAAELGLLEPALFELSTSALERKPTSIPSETMLSLAWDAVLVNLEWPERPDQPVPFLTAREQAAASGWRCAEVDLGAELTDLGLRKGLPPDVALEEDLEHVAGQVLALRGRMILLCGRKTRSPLLQAFLERLRARDQHLLVALLVAREDAEQAPECDQHRVVYLVEGYTDAFAMLLSRARAGRALSPCAGLAYRAGEVASYLLPWSSIERHRSTLLALRHGGADYRGAMPVLFLGLEEPEPQSCRRRRLAALCSIVAAWYENGYEGPLLLGDRNPLAEAHAFEEFLDALGYYRFAFRLQCQATVQALTLWNGKTGQLAEDGLELITVQGSLAELLSEQLEAFRGSGVHLEQAVAGPEPPSVALLSREAWRSRQLAGIVAGVRVGHGVQRGPELLELELSDRCNLQCAGCWIHDRAVRRHRRDQESVGFLPYEFLERLVDDAQDMGVTAIQLSGSGEPTLHPRFLDIVALVKRRGLWCNLVTNFTRLEAEELSALVELGLDQLTASLWAGDAATYQATHPGQGAETFEGISRRLGLLEDFKRQRGSLLPRVKLYHVISALNYRGLPAMIEHARSHGVASLEFQPVDVVEGVTEGLLLTRAMADEVLAVLEGLAVRADNIMTRVDPATLAEIGSELREFARFFLEERLPAGFRAHFEDLSAMRLTCKRGLANLRVEEDNFANAYAFHFGRSSCSRCHLLERCAIDRRTWNATAPFLSVLGIGSFRRRLGSVEVEAGRYEQLVDTLPCYVGWTYSRITAAGKVLPCCKASRMPMGDLREQSFGAVWRSPRYERFRTLALTCSKRDRYFAPIECLKSCDNLGMNVSFHEFYKKVGARKES
ncbi:MAG: hypothetical protein A2284_02945 [Deltaproteobacteria bacterium RIFOXYA12_FULL_61_11]|nr:MAG: hypothetical protein A2284_02945 [Deltaproteobacteria bacterium RIFOXYA12_FULL_61_11]